MSAILASLTQIYFSFAGTPHLNRETKSNVIPSLAAIAA